MSLSLDPSIVKINAVPPTTATASLNIRNKGNKQISLQAQVKPFKARGENGELEYQDPKDFSMLSNIQILSNGTPAENITLGPDQEKKLTISINIPKNTNISDYYFSIIFISQDISNPALNISSNMSLNRLGIAANVLLSIGQEIPNAVLEEFSSDYFFEKGPVEFAVRIKNKGNHLIRPKGEIIIKNMFGQNIGKIDISSVNILSNSIRLIPDTSWRENFLLGFYTATANISLSDNGSLFTKSISFFAFPFQGILLIVITIIMIIIIRNRLRIYMNQSE